MNFIGHSPEQAVFRALADPTRRHILSLLAVDDLSIAEVADRFDMTRAAVKKHLVVLEQGNLVSVTARGRERINRLNPAALRPAIEWLDYFDRFWDERLSALKNAVEGATDGRTDESVDQDR